MDPTTYTDAEARLAQKTIELGRAERLANDLWETLWEGVKQLPSYPAYAEARETESDCRIELTKIQREVAA